MNIKELRKKLRISQQDLADDTGIDRSKIGKWEIGIANPKVEDYKKLEKYFSEKGVLNATSEIAAADGNKEEIEDKYIKSLEQSNKLLQQLVEVNLSSISSRLHEIATQQVIARAEVRAFGEYQVMKDAKGDDEKRKLIMAQINNLIGANLQVNEAEYNRADADR